MKVVEWLKIVAAEGGSDLYLSTGAPPCAKFQGQLKPIGSDILQPGEIRELAYEMMDQVQREDFERDLEMNLARSISGYGRFRINVFMQRNEVGIVARNIVADIPAWEDLCLPQVLAEVVMRPRGLVLVAGQSGAGKSTSLAALVDYRNSNSSGHIVTIEDPVEFVHNHKQSIVNQREVGVDTRSWHSALKNTLRQSPDVVMIGEIRDRETLEHAIAFSETGHLCISSINALDTVQALDRLVNFFPQDRHPQLLLDLALNLQGVVSQRLVSTAEGSRCAAFEVLLGTPMVAEQVRSGDLEGLRDIMAKSGNIGMRTVDASLLELYRDGVIDEEEALRSAHCEEELGLQMRYVKEARQDSGDSSHAGLAVQEEIEPRPF